MLQKLGVPLTPSVRNSYQLVLAWQLDLWACLVPARHGTEKLLILWPESTWNLNSDEVKHLTVTSFDISNLGFHLVARIRIFSVDFWRISSFSLPSFCGSWRLIAVTTTSTWSRGLTKPLLGRMSALSGAVNFSLKLKLSLQFEWNYWSNHTETSF